MPELTAEFYLETINPLFREYALAQGRVPWLGRTVNPGTIRKTASLTHSCPQLIFYGEINMPMRDPGLPQRDCTLFTLNIDDKIYRCPVSAEALYMLCRDQSRSMSRIDAYLDLKQKVQARVEQKLGEGRVPELLDVRDFLG